MAKKKLTPLEQIDLRNDFLLKREELLRSKVNAMQVKLFDNIFDSYLLGLQDKDGKLLNSIENRNLVAGLDKIYKEFNKDFNIPIVKIFIGDMNEVHDLNKSYFNTIDKKETQAKSPEVKKIMDAQLGIKSDGSIKKGGFTDKFVRDETALKKIKKITNQAISKGQDFKSFKKDLQETIKGNPKLKESGVLQANYRTYAYDTIQKVDALNQTQYAKRLNLKYFIYKGGLIRDSRNFCIHRNGKILESTEFAKLTYNTLPPNQRGGIPKSGWKPMLDRGGYNCRHTISFVSTAFAEQNKAPFNKQATARNLKVEKSFKKK